MAYFVAKIQIQRQLTLYKYKTLKVMFLEYWNSEFYIITKAVL